MDTVGLAKAVYGAWQLQDWRALRELFHPEAQLQTQASGEDVLSGEETLRLLERTAREGIYKAVVLEFSELDDQAALLSGRVRYKYHLGGFADDPLCWIYVFRGGLLYRSRVLRDENQGRAAYAELRAEISAER